MTMVEMIDFKDYQIDYDLKRGAPLGSAHELIEPAVQGKVPGLPALGDFAGMNPESLTYAGDESGGNFIGHPRFRNNRAEFHNVDPDQIITTAGGMNGITFYIQYLNYLEKKAGNPFRPITILTESPTYDRTIQNVRDVQRCEWKAVPIIDGKLDMDRLEDALNGVDVFYLIYEGQNPSSIRYTPKEIADIKKKCREKGVKLLMDGAYQNLVYEGEMHDVDYSGEEDVTYVFSFTKEVAAGLKQGYMVVPKSAAADFNYVVSNVRLNPQYANDLWYSHLLEHPLYQQNLNHLRDTYRQRALVTVATLRELNKLVLKPKGLEIKANDELAAGFFSLFNMPEINTPEQRAQMIRSMATKGVAMTQNVDSFHPDLREASNAWGAFRYPFASQPDEATIKDAIGRIGESLIEVTQS